MRMPSLFQEVSGTYFNTLLKKYLQKGLNDVRLSKFHVKPEFYYLITDTVIGD